MKTSQTASAKRSVAYLCLPFARERFREHLSLPVAWGTFERAGRVLCRSETIRPLAEAAMAFGSG